MILIFLLSWSKTFHFCNVPHFIKLNPVFFLFIIYSSDLICTNKVSFVFPLLSNLSAYSYLLSLYMYTYTYIYIYLSLSLFLNLNLFLSLNLNLSFSQSLSLNQNLSISLNLNLSIYFSLFALSPSLRYLFIYLLLNYTHDLWMTHSNS